MALVVNFEKVKTEMPEKDQFELGLYLSVLGVPSITKDSLDEIKMRDRVFRAIIPQHRDRLGGWDLNKPTVDWEAYIGFSVNAMFETRSKWFNRISKGYVKPIPAKIAKRL